MFNHVSCQVVPPSGWSYIEPGMPSEHFESDEESLRKWLEGYRIANGIEPGNPSLDIQIYNGRKNTRLPAPPSVPVAATVQPTIRNRVTNWLSNIFQGSIKEPLEYIQEDEAEARAKICSNCPQNQDWKTGCPPCVQNAERIILMITQGRMTEKDSSLFACNVMGHSNKAAVQLNKKYLGTSEELPDFCWLKNV